MGGAHVGLHDFDEFNRERAGRRAEDGLFGTSTSLVVAIQEGEDLVSCGHVALGKNLAKGPIEEGGLGAGRDVGKGLHDLPRSAKLELILGEQPCRHRALHRVRRPHEQCLDEVTHALLRGLGCLAG